MLRVEFHCHTEYSKDSLTSPAALLNACRRKGIDRVIITDHNTIAGARAAKLLDPDRVIVGEEIMTTGGELLAAFLSTEVPPGLSPLETIRLLRQQGAFISIAHPFDSSRKGAWKADTLIDIYQQVDAIEVFNSRCILPSSNGRAREFAHQHNLAATVGSDAHTAFELGRSVLLLDPFEDAEGLRRVIRQGVPHTRWSLPWIHFTSRYAQFRKRLGLGLDTATRA